MKPMLVEICPKIYAESIHYTVSKSKSQIPLTHRLISVSPKPLNELLGNFIKNFLIGVSNDFEKLSWIRDS